MIINHNLSSINASYNFISINISQEKNIASLTSGLRIGRASDNAAGLAISEKMRSQIRGLNQAARNINDGISFVQVADGYLQSTTNSIQRIRELAIQAANGIYTDEDRLYMQVEVSQIINEIDRIASHAQFNGMNILTGRFDGRYSGIAMSIHLGSNIDQVSTLSIRNMSSTAISLKGNNGEGGIFLTDPESANASIMILDYSLQQVISQRADLGAYQNRMELLIQSQMLASENLQSAESQIRDLNMADGIVQLTKGQLLSQSIVAMMAQANQSSQSVLRLLG